MKAISPLSVLLLVAFTIAAQRTATTTDGQKVVLNSDGTWKPVQSAPAPVTDTDPRLRMSVRPVSIADATAMVITLRADLQKSEFETEAEYLSRVEKLAKEKKYLTGGTLYQTIIATDSGITYDAEKKAFEFRAPRVISVQRGSYTYLVLLSYVNRKYGDWTSDFLESRLPNLPMDAEQARAEKPNLRIGIEGIPVATDPKGDTLSIWPRRVFVFNVATGKVYSETPATFL